MAVHELGTAPRDIAIANMIRRLVEWHGKELLLLKLYRQNIDSHPMTKDQKDGYLVCLENMIEILEGFPLRVDVVTGERMVRVTVDGETIGKGTLQ